ncbi:MAG: hypothetical protein HY372_00680, partial [Candidatus Andersenbacteria bacterium]|nr:hypothetical protein [Candidatus Andersenbacteria bacterium]
AILRIIQRRLFEDRPLPNIATSLLQELIRGNYIRPCPQSIARTIATQLQRTKRVLANLEPSQADWFLTLVAVAIDHQLFPPNRQHALVHLMYHDTFRRIVWADNYVADSDQSTQLYLACHRALYAADDYELAYHYFNHRFPAWQADDPAAADLIDLSQALPTFRAQIEQALHHPARDRLLRLLRPVAVPYLIVRDILHTQRGIAPDNAEALSAAGREAYGERIYLTRGRMSRRAWHSILFLFLTKTLLAVLVEIPYERYLLGTVHPLALLSNISFHPLLLFILATAVRLPGETNAERVAEQLKRIWTGEGELPTVVVSQPRRYGSATWSAFAIFYAVLFMLIFWALFSFLDRLNFSLLAMFFFVVFLGLVSFLATRIRRSVDDLRIIPRREGAFSALFSFLALPVLEFGRWLAQNIRQLNVILFLMDRVLEAPFKLLIDIFEEWFEFVRDRREEIVK